MAECHFCTFMPIARIFALIFIAALLNGCEEPVEMDIPAAEQQTVAFASQSCNDTLRVFIARTRHIYDTAVNRGCDPTAIAAIVHKGNETRLLYNGERFTAPGFKAMPGDTVVLRIAGDGGNYSRAQAIVPESTVNHSVDIALSALLIDDVYYSRVQLDFYDPAGETNYYEFSLNVIFTENDSSYTFGYHYFKSFDPIMVNEDIMQYEPITMLFSDAMFNGSAVSIPLYYFLGFWNDKYQKVVVVSELRNISREHYQYYKTLYKEMYNESGIWSGMSMPFSIKGNVENGAGLFSLFTSTHDTVVYDFR